MEFVSIVKTLYEICIHTDPFLFSAKKLTNVTLVSMDVTSMPNAPIQREVTSARARLVTMEMVFPVIVSSFSTVIDYIFVSFFF